MNKFLCLAGFFLILVSCTGVNQKVVTTPAVTDSTATHAPSLASTPTQTITPRPTAKPVMPTATATKAVCGDSDQDSGGCSETYTSIPIIPVSAPEWLVPTILGETEVYSTWIGPDVETLSWSKDGQVIINGPGDQYILSPRTGERISIPTSTHVPYSTEVWAQSLSRVIIEESPNNTYSTEYDQVKKETRLIRLADQALIHIFPENCFSLVWAPDESAIAYRMIDDDYPTTAYVWSLEEKKPTKLGTGNYVHLDWSPDSKKILAQSQGYDYENNIGINWVHIFTNQGQPYSSFEVVKGRILEGFINWHTNDVVDAIIRNGAFGTYHHYYDAAQGVALGEWYRSSDRFSAYPYGTQPLMLSPDQRWHVLDETDPEQPFDRQIHTYGLYDLKNKVGHTLSSGPDRQIQFLAWTDDSQTFNLVNRPAHESALTSEEMPFGWLTLNPKTMEYTPVFVHALFVKYNPAKTLAWTVYPAKRPDGSTGMDGAIYNIAEKTLSERQFIARKIMYDYPELSDYTPVEWSHDGEKLVFLDQDGNLTLLSTNGEKVGLGKDMLPEGIGLSSTIYRFIWSPDDRWLIVHGDISFWVLDLRSVMP